MRLLLATAACACLTIAAPASAEPVQAGVFTVEGTYALAWQDKALKVEAHVVGSAVRDSEPWNPCGGAPPGYSLRFIPNPDPSKSSYYIYDSDGTMVKYCGMPPVVTMPIVVFALGIRIANSCQSGGTFIQIDPITTVTPAAAIGSTTREEVRFDVTETYEPVAGVTAQVCVIESWNHRFPNRECAAFFDPDLCATESEGRQQVRGRGHLALIRTRTLRCPAAKRGAERVSKRIRLLASALRRKPGRQPGKEKLLEDLRVFDAPSARERVVGECS